MINRININEDAEIIFAKGECSYNEVMNDFENANIIKIVTFNISSENTDLLDKISRLSSDQKEIDLITNIPNRYATYFSSYARRRAKKNIDSYIEQLNPENFESSVSSYFNFDNHSKIILTENIAYIGSANASDESINNYECGTIIRSKSAIKQIIEQIIPILKEDSEEYYGDSYSRITILLMNLLNKLTNYKEQFHMSFYSIWDHRGNSQEYYDNWNSDISPITIENIENCIYEYQEIIEELGNLEEFEFKSLDSQFIDSLIDIIYDYLHDFSKFDVSDRANYYISQNPEAYDENLNDCAEDSFQRASDEKSDMANSIEDEVIKFEMGIGNIIDNMQQIFKLLCTYKRINEEIDNTGL